MRSGFTSYNKCKPFAFGTLETSACIGRCAVVSFSQIRSRSLNLSAKYHLFEGTYDELSRIIGHSNLTQTKQLIEGILKGGSYRSIDDRKTVKVHPEVV